MMERRGTRKEAAAPAVVRSLRLLAPAVFILHLVLLSCCFQELRALDANFTLDQKEVVALRQIAVKLKVLPALWDFRRNPCGWGSTNLSKLVFSNFTCGNCNINTSVCHVVNIELKGQNLTGVLPEELGKLTSLAQIDLTRNYITGSIPAAAWASLPLINISLLGNRISGPIPEAIGKISTLESLVLEDNLLNGLLPRSLGNLTRLSRLLLSANNFTGVLPETLGRLKNLTDFRIDGNDISGKIPNFMGNWTKLQRLDMQGTSLEGPFPSSFSQMVNIAELRITDLKSSDGNFPNMNRMKNMKYLVLRNCSLSGKIPEYLQNMANLKTLDLSFNNLTGAVPSLKLLQKLQKLYLTNNKLNGSTSDWAPLGGKFDNLDISYNTFTRDVPPTGCSLGSRNYVASFSSTQDGSVDTCLRKDLPCPGKAKNYEFFINCGGKKITIDGTVYEDDSLNLGTSSFVRSIGGKWAYSSTGDFVGKDSLGYRAENTSILKMPNPGLYTWARTNPLSLKYYGLCMQSGDYTVKLHFAEIIFTDDLTFFANGRRYFDLSIQGKKVLEDFNIAQAANGTHKEIIKTFIAHVEHSTLEIHFQWRGKGTNAIPDRGYYGPLVSAISVKPNFEPELDDEKLSVGTIVGIVVPSCVLVILLLILLWFYLKKRKRENNELSGLELHVSSYGLRQIKAATRNFDPSNKIGEGGFGPVYKGVLPDGTAIAVKQLSAKSKQGNREFVNEIGMISALQHPNLVRLFGCCIEGNQLLLIYEYMENNSLARALFGSDDARLKLDWKTRYKICLDVARGLAFLHEESRLKIVHRDIKATNILLDKDLNAKISDFGLAKLDEEVDTHISTRIAGTMGYMAPEYAMRGYLTDKADVYSFGVVTLEIVSGQSNTSYRARADSFYLLDQAYVLQEQEKLLELVDPSLENYSMQEAQRMLDIALVCTNPSPTLRPSMSSVVSMLEHRTPVKVPSVKHTQGPGSGLFMPLMNVSFDSQTHSTSMNTLLVNSSASYDGQMHSTSMDTAWADSVVSHDSQMRSATMETPCVDSSVSTYSSKADTSDSYSSTSKLMHSTSMDTPWADPVVSRDSQMRSTTMDTPFVDSSVSIHSSKADTSDSYSSTSKLLSDY